MYLIETRSRAWVSLLFVFPFGSCSFTRCFIVEGIAMRRRSVPVIWLVWRVAMSVDQTDQEKMRSVGPADQSVFVKKCLSRGAHMFKIHWVSGLVGQPTHRCLRGRGRPTVEPPATSSLDPSVESVSSHVGLRKLSRCSGFKNVFLRPFLVVSAGLWHRINLLPFSSVSDHPFDWH